jgi:outer membrane protein assembly factor BamD (BamD/ComL family)
VAIASWLALPACAGDSDSVAKRLLEEARRAREAKKPALAQYYEGLAAFASKDLLNAGRTLNRLAPFNDPLWGTHARYIVGRIHHLADERAEAQVQYEGVLAGHDKVRAQAAELLKQPIRDASERQRLEALVRNSPPEHVGRAGFYLGVLLGDAGRFADAAQRFASFIQQQPRSPLLLEAQVRLGICLVQAKQNGDAVRVFEALARAHPELADQILYWLGKAQAGAGDPNQPASMQQSLARAIDTLSRAAEAASKQADTARRSEILLELADTQVLAQRYREAAKNYYEILDQKWLPGRQEELLERYVSALTLTGEYTISDKAAAAFVDRFPKSLLLPAVMFRQVENADFQALAAEKDPGRKQEAERFSEESSRRCRVLIERFPEFAYVNTARFNLAMSHYRQRDFEKAREVLETISAADRAGELAIVSYVQADCLMRLAPARADDALAVGRLEEQLKQASELLESFASAQGNGSYAIDASLRQGYCQQRLAALIAQPGERQKAYAAAEATYVRMRGQFANHPIQPFVVLERAKCRYHAGQVGTALSDLKRFLDIEPFRGSPIAPLGLIELGSILRFQKQPVPSAALLTECQRRHEAAMLKDPARAAWVPVLHYQLAMSLKESGKLAEAKELFMNLARRTAEPMSSEALLRWGQCVRQEAALKMDKLRPQWSKRGGPMEQAAKAIKEAKNLLTETQQVSTDVSARPVQLKATQPESEIRARLLYEAAWEGRLCAEVESAELELVLRPSDPRIVPPAELLARSSYQALTEAFPDLPLANEARLEWSELLAERGEFDAAIKLLREALDKEPPAELTDKIRVRLGFCLLAKGDAKAGQTQLESVVRNGRSTYFGHAQYGAGCCLAELKDPSAAIQRLHMVRDRRPWRDQPGLADRALFTLGQLHGRVKQWDQSRQAFEQVVNRFGNSSFAEPARERLRVLADKKLLEKPETAALFAGLQNSPAVLAWLPPLAHHVVEPPTFDDPTAEFSTRTALAGAVPERKTPAPFLKMSLPEPFEHRVTLKLPAAPEDLTAFLSTSPPMRP